MDPRLWVVDEFIRSQETQALVYLYLLLKEPFFATWVQTSGNIFLRLSLVVVFGPIYLVFLQN